MSRIGRRIFCTRCVGFGFDENNNRFDVDETLFRRCTDINRATSLIQKKYNNPRIVIKTIEITSKYCSMPADYFFAHCDQITDSDSQIEKENENV